MVNNLTLGIPQSDANPLLDVFNDSAEQHRRAMEQWHQEQTSKIDRALLEPDAFFAENPVPAYDPDPVRARDSLTVAAYLALQNGGKPVTGSLYPEIFRDRIAAERFAGRGAGSDQAFLGEIRREAQERKDATAFMQDVSRSAAQSALMASAGEPAADWSAWIAEARQRPGYRRGIEDLYFDEWQERRRQQEERLAPVRDVIAAQWTAMKAGQTADLGALDDLMADEQDRETLLFALGGMVKALPKEQQPSVLANLRKQFLRRDLPAQLGGLRRSLRPLDAEQELPADYADQLEPGGDAEAFMRQQRQQFEADTRLRDRFVRKLESIVHDEYDPIVPLAKEGSAMAALERGLYAAPGVALTMATASLPGVGPQASYEVLRQDSTDMARQSLIQGGMGENDADLAAEQIGTVSALIQLPMERLGLAAVTNRLPVLNKAIQKLTTNLATRYLARAGSTATVETLTELGQDLVPSIVQEIGAAASQDMPDVQWTGEGGVFQDYDKQTLEVLGAILPLSLIMAGGGVFTDRQIRDTAALPDLTLRAAGLRPESIAALRAAKGIGEQEAALRTAWQSRDMTTPEAVAAQQELTDRTRADQDAAAAASDAGILPRAVRSADGGWTLYDTATGAEVGRADDWQGAARLATAHANFQQEQDADRIAAVFTTYQAAEASGDWSQATGRSTETQLDLGTELTTADIAAQSAASRARAEAQDRMMGGDGSIPRQILGQSSTELAGNQLRTVNRILQGGSVLDVFHEEAHGFRRAARAAGTLTYEDDVAFVQAVNQVLQGSTREGQSLALLPADFATLSPEAQEIAVDEAVSQIMEAEIIRTRKGASNRQSSIVNRQLPAGLVSKNLSALSRLLGDRTLGKFRSFIAAMREFFGLAIDRAAQIQRGLADGSLSRDTYEGYLAKLLGVDQQLDFEQMARDAEAAILAGDAMPAIPEGDPFSLGRAVLPPTTKAKSPEASPRAQEQSDSRIASQDSTQVRFNPRRLPGDGETDTSFSLGRARENFEKAKWAVEQARFNVSYAEQRAATAKETWETKHGRTAIQQAGQGIVASNGITRPEDIKVELISPSKLKLSSGRWSSGTIIKADRIIWEGVEIFRADGFDFEPFPPSADLVAARAALIDAEVELYLAAEDFDPETDARQAASEAIRQRELSRQAAAFAALLDARDQVARKAAGSFVARVWNAYARHDELFQFGRTTSKAADDIAATVSMPGRRVTASDSGDTIRFMGKDGYLDIAEADTNRPYIRATSAGSQGKKSGGGSQLYAAALDWIHNNGKRIKDDPGGLTSINAIRRTSNFLASAIRHGTTRHLKPHASQSLDKWTQSDVLNIALLANKESDNAFNAIPQARGWTFDFESGTFSADGKPLTEADIAAAITAEIATRYGVGISTLQRAVITRSAVEAFQRGEAESVVESAESGLPDSLTGISYSLGSRRLAVLTADSIRRIQDPLRRAQAMERASRKLEELRLEAERLELLAGAKRIKKSLAREAAMRQALRREELENEAYARHWQVLSDDDLTKLRAQPAHALFADPASPLRGRIQSRTQTIRLHPELYSFSDPAEYDGSEGVSPTVFGGTLTPDLAVDEAVGKGLLPPGSKPDALWNLLRSESAHVANMKRVLAAAKADLREARTVAKAETNAWLAEQGATQAENYSPRQEILRTLAALEGILSAFPPEIRGKVGGYVQAARIVDGDAALRFLQERLARVDNELEGYLKAQYDREFRELLDRARPEKDEAGKRPRGKIGADVHALFADLREAMTLTAAETEAEALRLETLAAQEDLTAAQQSHATLQAGLVRLVGDWPRATAARREAAVLEATRVFQSGYLAHKTEMLRQREDRATKRGALVQATGKAGTRPERRAREAKDTGTRAGRILKAGLSLLSFEQIVQKTFGESSPEAAMLIDWERRAAHAKADAVQHKLDLLDDLFTQLAGGRFKGEQLRFAMADRKTIQVKDSRGTVHDFSQLEAITLTLMARQEDGRRHMAGHVDDQGASVGDWNYDQAFIDAVEDQLTDDARTVRHHLAAQYAAEYDRLNAVFRQLYGVSLPRHAFYSPLTVKPTQAGAGQMLDPVTGSVMSGSGFTPGSLKTRSQTAIAEPDFRDALQTYIAHIKQMEHWIAYAPFTTEAMALLNSREVGNSVEAAAGQEALGILRSWLDHFAQGGTRDAAAHLAANQTLNRMMGRAAAVALVGRVSVLAIQSTQLAAALAEMPAAAYLTRLARLFAGRLDWSAALRSDYIQRRKASMPPIVQQAMEGLASSRPNRLKFAARKMGETISGADALFTAGTYAIAYDYHLQQARALNVADPAAYARQAAERSVDRVAQPVRPGTRSLFEVTGTNPAVRIVWSFASEPRQKLALAAYALGSKKPAGAKARALAVTWLAGGLLASLMRAAMRDLRDDDDDEVFDEQNWDPKRLALSSLTGPFAGIPYLGDLIEAATFKAFREYLPEGNMLSGAERATTTAARLLEGDTPADLEEAVKDAETLLSGAGLFSESAAAAASVSHLLRDLLGIVENATGTD